MRKEEKIERVLKKIAGLFGLPFRPRGKKNCIWRRVRGAMKKGLQRD